MSDLGLSHIFLGIEVWQINNHSFVSQTKYAKSLWDRFRVADCKISSTPMEKTLKLQPILIKRQLVNQ